MGVGGAGLKCAWGRESDIMFGEWCYKWEWSRSKTRESEGAAVEMGGNGKMRLGCVFYYYWIRFHSTCQTLIELKRWC